jgi:hypothetical protein
LDVDQLTEVEPEIFQEYSSADGLMAQLNRFGGLTDGAAWATRLGSNMAYVYVFRLLPLGVGATEQMFQAALVDHHRL